jgi:uncharacterized zinc-type alcohol dehydrogenase-like protein
MKDDNNISRRKFIQQSAVLGTGIMLAGATSLIGKENEREGMLQNIKSRGYAAKDTSGILSPWEFKRRQSAIMIF